MVVKRAYGTPGGYIGREKVRKYNAVLLGYFAYCLVSAFLIWTFLSDDLYSTLFWILVALSPLGAFVVRRELRAPMKSWFARLSGDREIARQLEPLVHGGYDVLHDVDLGRGNVDHVVVGPSGIYAIETKAWTGRFYLGGGGRRMRSGFFADNVRKQAVRSAALVENRLAMCGLDASVVAVVALASSTLPHGPMSVRHAHVVDGQNLATWIARRTVRLGTLEIDRARAALTPYVTT